MPDFENELIAGLAMPGINQPGSTEIPLSLGPSLQARYPVNRLVLIPQGPFRIFAFWDLAPGFLKEKLRRFPKRDRSSFQLVFRCFQAGEEPLRWLDPGATLDWWFDTHPDRSYRAQLCLYSPEYGLHPVLDSNEVHTPPLAIRSRTTEPGKFLAVLPVLQELAHKTGLPFQMGREKPADGGTAPLPSASLEPPVPQGEPEVVLAEPPSEIPLPRPTSH